MTTNIGKKYTFVGITNRDSLTLDIVGYLQDTLDAFTEKLGPTPTSPASEFILM